MEGEPKLDFEGFEKPKFHYTYADYSQEGHPMIFECDADGIPEADAKFEAEQGFSCNSKNKKISRSFIEN